MNISHSNTYPSLDSSQRGAVLIVVLLFLILIMLVGVIAVRNSNTDLKLATSDQINTLLLQSADSVNNKIEISVNGSPASEQYKQIMGITGIFGYYILEDNNDDIIDFCYRPRSSFSILMMPLYVVIRVSWSTIQQVIVTLPKLLTIPVIVIRQ